MVQEIIATSEDVQVVINNAGNAPVTESFWVDLYIDPASPPTAANQVWSDLADEGLVWGISTPMQPGDVVVLTVGDANYWDLISQVSWPLVPDTWVYVQVDSWNVDAPYGAVLESHEIVHGPYENNIGYTRVRRDAEGDPARLTTGIARLPALAGELPPRPEPWPDTP